MPQDPATPRPHDTGVRRSARGVHMLCPHRMVSHVGEVTVEHLREMGIDTVLLDIDNTLVGWQRTDLTDAVREWLATLRQAGFKLYLVSNSHFGKRAVKLSEELGIPYVRSAAKPRRRGFLHAMKELGSDPSKTVMIGDQMFTDVFGGNRCGLYTVMVAPIARREFIGTKVSRAFERLMLRWFKRRGHI